MIDMSYPRDPTAPPVPTARHLAAHQTRDLRGALGFDHHSADEYPVDPV